MFRVTRLGKRWGRRFPRIRGDVPERRTGGLLFGLFSPHTRGCSATIDNPVATKKVFPAYAGMFRAARNIYRNHNGFPRIRGDVPPHGFG